MRLREKGKTDGEIVHMGWDEGQAALAAGTHEVAEGTETRPTKGDDDPGDPAGDGLDGLTRDQLDRLAAERGVDVSAAKTKADVIEALRAPR